MAIAANPFDPDWWTSVTLSDAELANIVQRAGFSSSRTHGGVREDAVAVAIILAESGGDPNAHNDNPPDDSYGLFQINMYDELGPARAERYGLQSYANLFEPRKNAAVAFDIFRRAGFQFTDWSTWNNGSYARFLNRAKKAVQNPSGDIPTLESQLESNIPGVSELVALANFLTSPDNWKRVAWFVGGGVLIIMGLILAVGPTVARATVGRYARALRLGRR